MRPSQAGFQTSFGASTASCRAPPSQPRGAALRGDSGAPRRPLAVLATAGDRPRGPERRRRAEGRRVGAFEGRHIGEN